MTVSFDFQNVILTEFGVGRDSEKGESFVLVPVDSDVQVALQEMAISTRDEMDKIDSDPAVYEASEKHGSNDHVYLPLQDEMALQMKSIRRLGLCQHRRARPYADWLHVSVERADHDMHALGHRSREQSLLSPHLPQLARCSRLTHRCATAHDAAFEYHHHSKLRGYSSRRLAAGA